MLIKKVIAKSIKDSRGEKTIQVIVKTSKGKFVTSSPSGKSKGKYEAKSYARWGLNGDIKFINNLDVEKINKIISKSNITGWDKASIILKDIEKLIGDRVGANSLFALESSLLKSFSKENKKSLWKFLNPKAKGFPLPVGNAVGGGLHSKGIKGEKPDFQEFLFISNGKTFAECVKINKLAYKLVGGLLKARRRNDEGAWETNLGNDMVLNIMNEVRRKIGGGKIKIGLDVAGSSFYKNGIYDYKNPIQKISRNEQIKYIKKLIKDYNLFYIEDGLNENDFSGFRTIKNSRILIVGDDLTATNPSRLKKAIRVRAINGIIVKPNQIGSLLKVKEVIDIARRAGIKTIISHRSGETRDDTIADFGVGFGCDFIKTGIYGSCRVAKLKRLIKIERRL